MYHHPGKDVQASAARSAQLLGNDLDLAQAQSSRISGEPVLQPYFVVTQVPQLCGLSGVHWKPWQIVRHGYHRSDLVYRVDANSATQPKSSSCPHAVGTTCPSDA